jgi:branched-chain amino acid transport system substrate-binding protein
MRRLALCSFSVMALAVGCGGDDRAPADGPPARAVASSTCSPIVYGGPGRPRFLIAVSSHFQGVFRGHGVQTAQAVKMVLGQRGWRAGEYTVGMQACEESDADSSSTSPGKCRRNARAFAGDPSVLGVIGPLSSDCASYMLKTLNTAPGGPLATISGGNTYLGLTRAGPGTQPGEPGRYAPTGRRGYARLAPADDAQSAANALLVRDLRAEPVFVVQDGGAYGRGLAAGFIATARRLGVEIAGGRSWDPKATGYRSLARQIRASGARAVFIAGYLDSNGGQLIEDLTAVLDRDVHLLSGDGFNQSAPVVEAAGARAEGFRSSIAVLPNRSLPPAGRRFAAEFERRFGQRPCCFSVHDAQGTGMLLDAIAATGGRRAAVADRVMHARVKGGLVGDFAIDRHGDTTLNTIAIYRIRGGRLRFETAIDPAPELLARR